MSRYYLNNDPLNIARGLVDKASIVNIFGYNTSIGSTFVAPWEDSAAYVFPSSAVTMSVVSDEADDDSQTVRIIGLDSNYDVLVEDIDLDGTNAVTTTNQFLRINTVIVTSGNPTGNITVSNGGTTYGKININGGTHGKSQMAIYTVPRNHNLYLYRINAYAGTTTDESMAGFRNLTQVVTDGNTQFRVGETLFKGQFEIQRRAPFEYTEKTDIQLQLRKLAGDDIIGGVFAEAILIEGNS